MPIYEYRCGACGHRDEHLQKISDKPLATCPACGKRTYKKQLSAAGFQLKGSGWYATDFRNSGKAAAKPAESKSESKPEKTESKPASDGASATKPKPTTSSGDAD